MVNIAVELVCKMWGLQLYLQKPKKLTLQLLQSQKVPCFANFALPKYLWQFQPLIAFQSVFHDVKYCTFKPCMCASVFAVSIEEYAESASWRFTTKSKSSPDYNVHIINLLFQQSLHLSLHAYSWDISYHFLFPSVFSIYFLYPGVVWYLFTSITAF